MLIVVPSWRVGEFKNGLGWFYACVRRIRNGSDLLTLSWLLMSTMPAAFLETTLPINGSDGEAPT